MTDAHLFSLINSLATRWSLLDSIGIFLSRAAILALPFFSLSAGTAWFPLLFKSGIAATAALASNHLIGFFFFRARPFVDHAVNLLIPANPLSKSFPSDHTATAVAIALTIVFAHPKAGALALIASLCIGVSRVFVGVHYPVDILAGVFVGIVSAGVVQFFSARFGI
ncbi:phosphatase PAP2 family protein [Candidatus Uhrbacteria bacterium]|nr:phosphatase PAP2 family protein [Candidatus Uhrbacteria bacterium]